MSAIDVIILILVISFIASFALFYLINYIKGKPINTCSYCASKKGNKLLKDYHKKYKKRCGC